MPLSATAVKQAKPTHKTQRLFDSGGMYLEISPAGGKLAPLVFVRPGELRHAEWTEFDLAKAEWNIPAEKMKMRLPHLVPLSPQAVAILQELQPLTGTGKYLFPSARSPKRPMSNNAVLSALRRMAVDLTGIISMDHTL